MARTNWPPKSAFGWALADAISAPRRAARPPDDLKGGDAAARGPRTEEFSTPYDEHTTMKAWECLLSGEDGDGQRRFPVRPLIGDSWSRCASCGIDARQREAPLNHGIDALIEQNRDLLAAARRSFGTIGRLLDGTGAMLVLADRNGVLIDAIGDRRTLHDGMDINLSIGGKWTEDVVGTNGIGTALWAGAPVFVHAAEHFCAGIKSWTCAGAPIREPFDNSIIGVVDLSGHPDIFRPHNIGLVAAAAQEIEKALAEQRNEERARLLEAFISSAPEYRRSDGLLIVDHRGRPIYCHNVAESTLRAFRANPPTPAAERRLVRFLESGNGAELDNDAMLALQNCHFSPLQADNGMRGAALVFPTREARPSPAARRADADASDSQANCIIGESPALRRAIEIASRVAATPDVTSVLIEGETGVGKELFTRLIHGGTRHRSDSPFVTLNCGAITRELFGSELFGHVPGAFTGASRDGKPGVFELANGGALCLDEIGEMPPEIQPFLLRVLEERVVRRLGDSRARPVDVRLIASTNRDLRQEVEQGRFRRDLFYRISAVTIHVPPLRERGDDVLLLIEHFNSRFAARLGTAPLTFAAEALDILRAYRWPGNVRELRNLVEKLHILWRGTRVGPEDLPAEFHARPEEPALLPATAPRPHSIEEAECQAIRDVLLAEKGNLSRAAQKLGISRPTLYRKLDQFGIRRGFV